MWATQVCGQKLSGRGRACNNSTSTLHHFTAQSQILSYYTLTHCTSFRDTLGRLVCLHKRDTDSMRQQLMVSRRLCSLQQLGSASRPPSWLWLPQPITHLASKPIQCATLALEGIHLDSRQVSRA